MTSSPLNVSASLLLLLGLGVMGCGQAVEHAATDSPPSDGGEGPVLDNAAPPGGSAAKPPRKVGATPVAAAGAGGAGGADNDENRAPETTPNVAAGADTVPPQIVSIQPGNAAVGVAANARIVIEFNEPMHQHATAAAFASDSLPPTQTVMTWNDAGTILTITPKVALDCAHATLSGAEPLELAAKTYAYTLTHHASDLAGNPAADTHVTFSTLREVTHTLTPVADLTGVLSDENGSYGFLTFDLGTLPAGISQLKSAVARTGTYRVTAPIAIDHVEFDQLSPAAITAGPGSLIVTLPSGLSGDQMIPASVSAFMARDYEQRSPAHHYSQYRMDLSGYTAPADLNRVAQLLAESSIEADYLLP